MMTMNEFIISISSANLSKEAVERLIETKIKADSDFLAREKEAKIKADGAVVIAQIQARNSSKNKVIFLFVYLKLLFVIIYLFKIDGFELLMFSVLLGFVTFLINPIKVFSDTYTNATFTSLLSAIAAIFLWHCCSWLRNCVSSTIDGNDEIVEEAQALIVDDLSN
jgi:hypothetical protein